MKRKLFNQILVGVTLTSLIFTSGCQWGETLVPPTETPLVSSGYKIVENGMSEYQIVLPEESKVNEYTAAQELQTFLKKSSGAELPIVTDGEVSSDMPVISIGETTLAARKNIGVSGIDLASSAYKIKTEGESLYILSDEHGTGEGCIYGVYDLLEDVIGWCAYAADEIVYEEKSNVELYVYDEIVRPTFDRRSISYLDINNNETYRRRMRLINQYNNDFWCNPLFGHSQISNLLKKEYYFADHKYGSTKEVEENGTTVTVPNHWYSNSGEQLCYTGGEEMEQEMAKVLYEYIKLYPNATYFMLGQEDTKSYCWCDRCKAAMSSWGYNQTGLEIAFVNHVIEIIDEWVKTDYPEGRDLRYVIFAYHDTIVPPVVTENGETKAFSESVVPNKQMYVYFTPIETNYSATLEEVENEEVLKNLRGWYSLLNNEDRLIVYTYDTNFSYYFYNFDNFDTFRSQLKTYSEHGVGYMYSQGSVWTNQCTFQEMRIFVESKLMWNIDLSYDDLVNEFMSAYYKDAASAVRKYYDLTRRRYKQCETLSEMDFDSIYANIGGKEIWTTAVVSAFDGIFSEAYAALEHYKTEDPELYKTLTARIKRLELTVTYTKLKNYRANYSQAEINRLVDEFNQYTSLYSILDYKEEYSCSGMFDGYRK